MAENNRLEVFEVFEDFLKVTSRKERLDILKKHESWPLKDVLRGIFDDKVQWNLPRGEPPYKPCTVGTVPSTFLKQNVSLKYFVKGVRDSENMSVIKRERKFLDMLETVHPADAKLLVSMINKQNPVKGLTKKLVQEAYPDLIP
tara:strand:+ start:855 stop:1286 length:432 start_codon:yes stop_codon:yes gene_type:complete